MTVDDRMCYAPWTDEEVATLNEFQTTSMMHPFTCGVSSSHDKGYLFAIREGWICPEPSCEYTQNWAPGFMVDGSWRRHRDDLKRKWRLE